MEKMEKKVTKDELVKIATETLSFIKEKVGDSVDMVDIVLSEAQSQNYICKRLTIGDANFI